MAPVSTSTSQAQPNHIPVAPPAAALGLYLDLSNAAFPPPAAARAEARPTESPPAAAPAAASLERGVAGRDGFGGSDAPLPVGGSVAGLAVEQQSMRAREVSKPGGRRNRANTVTSRRSAAMLCRLASCWSSLPFAPSA